MIINWQPGNERTGEVSLKSAKIPASDLEALQVDRITVSLFVHDLEGQQIDTVAANTPVVINAGVVVVGAEGESDDNGVGPSLLTGFVDDIGEYKYAFEPILETSSASAASGGVSRPSWKEMEFLARVIAFSGPASGLVSFSPPNADARILGKASTAVCLFAHGVYRFRVRVWASQGGEEREARCDVRVSG